MIINIILRLTIWFLLTSDFSLANIIIGLSIAFLLPHSSAFPIKLKDWWPVLRDIIRAIPQAYVEAIEIIINPHRHEEIIMENVNPNRSKVLIFLDIFLITFTPKTIVLKYHEEGCYEVHRITRRQEI